MPLSSSIALESQSSNDKNSLNTIKKNPNLCLRKVMNHETDSTQPQNFLRLGKTEQP